jgi:hypothetical protein
MRKTGTKDRKDQQNGQDLSNRKELHRADLHRADLEIASKVWERNHERVPGHK